MIERNHIGWAIYKLKTGYRVRRKEWNPLARLAYVVPFVGPMAPYIIVQHSELESIPWTATQADLLAEDWELEPHER